MTEPKAKLNYSIRRLPGFKETPESVIETITKITCAAFDKDRFMELLLGGHWDLAPCIHRAFLIDFLVGGHVYVAELDDGKMIASAMWSGPGEALRKEELSAQEGFSTFMTTLVQKYPDVAKWWTEYYFEKYASFTKGCLNGPEFKRDGWALQIIGILPEYQSYGIGTALIKAVEDQILSNPNAGPAERKVSLETENERARKFYQKIGFTERGETTIEGHGSLGNCPMWCFAKEF